MTSSMKIAIISSIILSSGALTACKPKERTPAEQWQFFCKTYESAAYNIMTDRQSGIEKEKAVAHVMKIKEGKERDMIRALVEEAYHVKKYDLQREMDAEKEKFKQGRYQYCMELPENPANKK